MSFEPYYELTPRILRQIKAIERTVGMIDAVRMKPQWISEVRAKAKVREALASVQIEGNTLTLEQAFVLADKEPVHELRESEREFCNYLQAFDQIEGYRGARDVVIQKGDLLNLHSILLHRVRGGDRFAGQFRRENVEVGDIGGGTKTIHHRPSNWSEVEDQVGELLAWIESSKARGTGDDDPWVHPAIQAGIAHHRLVWIHPFVDGNGRTARMFTSMLLYQREYDFKYLFELSEFYNEHRGEYYETLRSADRTGDYTKWLTFFLGGLSYQMVRTQELIRSEED